MRNYIVLFQFVVVTVSAQQNSALLYPTEEFEILMKSENDELFLDKMFCTILPDSGETRLKKSLLLMKKEIAVYANTLRKYSTKKKIKKINQYLHDKYFKRYEEHSGFIDLLKYGTYNCVTASAFYIEALNKCSISSVIAVSENHVFVVADPDNERIIIEGTLPLGGVTKISKKKIDRISDMLVNNKLEDSKISNQQVFEEYMIGDTILSPNTLVGLELYNKALKLFERESYKKALYSIERAREIVSIPSVEKVSENILLSVLLEYSREISPKEYAFYLRRLLSVNEKLREEPEELQRAIVIMSRNEISRTYSAQKLDSIRMEISHLKILNIDSIPLSNAQRDLCFISAEYYHNNLEYKESFDRICQCYDREKYHNKALIKNMLEAYLVTLSEDELYINVKKVRRCIDFLNLNQNYMDEQALYHAKKISEAFRAEDEDNGWLLVRAFEKDFSISEILRISSEVVGSIYGEASAYYVRQNDYSKAKEVLNEGLAKSPDSEELHRKLKYLNE